MPDPIWTLEHVRLAGHPGDRLRDICVTIRAGTTVVVGRSGAGKTSLLNLLTGFEPPTAGAIRFHILATSDRLPIFWSPPDGGLWPHLNVAQHIHAVAPRVDGVDPDGILADFDLTQASAKLPEHLSQGQRSRLAVARALASGAQVLVMDEPLAHVDEGRLEDYWTVIRSHVKEHRIHLVFATHSPGTAIGEADHAIGMDNGRVVFSGDIAALYADPPNLMLAELLGPTNWLSEKDATRWLGAVALHGPCFRPHEVDVLPDPDGSVCVESSRSHGSYHTARLRHTTSGESRFFFHRPVNPALKVGARVALRACLLTLICLLQGGCGRAEGGALPVAEVHLWPMPPAGSRIPQPRSITNGEPGELIVLDNAGRILIFNEEGVLQRQWSMPDNRDGNPEGACRLADGRIAVADTHYHRVVFFDHKGVLLSTMGREGTEPGRFIFPVKITEDATGHFYVAEYGGNDRVQKFTAQGHFVLEFGGFSTAPGHFQRPGGLLWHEGRVYVTDVVNNRIQVFDDNGLFLHVLGADHNGAPMLSLKLPYDVAMGPQHRLYIVEYSSGRLTVVEPDGRLVGRYGSPGRGLGQFATPWGVAVLSDTRIVIADTGNRRLVEVVP